MRAKEIRTENHCFQEKIAKYLGVERATYSMWENELDLFPMKRLGDFCDYFKVSIDYVLNITDIKSYGNMRSIDINLSAKRLMQLRKRMHLTQAELAKILTIDQSLVSKYENGVTLVSTTFIEIYARKFCISTDYLLGRIDDAIIIKPKPRPKEKEKI